MGGKLGTPLERFERFYIPEPNSGCWLWVGAMTPMGYGQFYYPPRNMVRAHVAAYELFRGPRMGLHVLHSCDMACCVNPDHLRLGTHQENMDDREARQRRAPPKGSVNGRAKLTDLDVLSIRADIRRCEVIAAHYKISESAIKKIRQRQTWKHLP